MRHFFDYVLRTTIVLCGAAAGCNEQAATPAAGVPAPPQVMNIDRTQGRITAASVGWPTSITGISWLCEDDGSANVKLDAQTVHHFAFSGFTLLASGGEIAGAEFRMPDESFDEAYQRAKAMAVDFGLQHTDKLEEWYAVDRKHHTPMTAAASRKGPGYTVAINIGVIAIPKTQAYVRVRYNFRSTGEASKEARR